MKIFFAGAITPLINRVITPSPEGDKLLGRGDILTVAVHGGIESVVPMGTRARSIHRRGHRLFPRRPSPCPSPVRDLPGSAKGHTRRPSTWQTSRSSRTLHLRTRPTGSLACFSSRAAATTRPAPPEPRRHRRLQIREHRPSLLTARRHHRPDPLTPPVAALAPRPLRDQAVDHHEPDRLLRQVVRRLQPGRR